MGFVIFMQTKSKDILKEINLFNNDNFDDCKSKLNSIIYILFGMQKDRNQDSLSYIYKHNKNALLFYLNIAKDIFNNQNINESILMGLDLSFINVEKGPFDINTLEGRVILINQIRNSFAHKSGLLNFYIEDGKQMVKINNKAWFSITCELDKLNNLFDSISNKSIIDDVINSIKNDDYSSISEDGKILVYLNALMCYNKESMFDTYMLSQTSLMDASKFKVTTSDIWINDKKSINRNFFDKFNLSFNNEEDKTNCNSEWGNIINNSLNDKEFTYTYNQDHFAYDNHSKKHIPTPLLLRAFRDACSHGFIEINGDTFIFYDKNEKTNNGIEIKLEINKNDLIKFLNNDYFTECLLTSVSDHKTVNTNELYVLEQMKSKSKFNNYMNIFKSRFLYLNEKELILYMYDNNKFSSYLLENPKELENFKEYTLEDGTKLYDFLFESAKKSQFPSDKPIENRDMLNVIRLDLMVNCFNSLIDYYKVLIEDYDNTKKDYNNDCYKFFILYNLFLRNINTITPNMDMHELYSDVDSLNKLREKVRKLNGTLYRYDFFSVNKDEPINLYRLFAFFTEVSFQNCTLGEINKIKIVEDFINSACDEEAYDLDVVAFSKSLTSFNRNQIYNEKQLFNLSEEIKPEKVVFIKKLFANLMHYNTKGITTKLGYDRKLKYSDLKKLDFEDSYLLFGLLHVKFIFEISEYFRDNDLDAEKKKIRNKIKKEEF